MIKLIIAIFFGGTGIIQLLEKNYKAFLRCLIAWILEVACYIYLNIVPEDKLNAIEEDNPMYLGVLLLLITFILFGSHIYLLVFHISTIIRVAKELPHKR